MSPLAQPTTSASSTSRRPVPRRRATLPGLLLLLALSMAWPGLAQATIARTVRWAASPLKGPSGQTLPPAVSYEVWLVEDAKPESLAATVADTSWVLQAKPGAVYAVRVRGISALGLKSPFSPWSDTWRAVAAPAGDPVAGPALAAARPNPFNARTAFAYTVPPDQAADAALALEIYDVRGHRVRNLPVDRAPGAHEAAWEGTDAGGRPVAAGVYLARFACGAYRATARVTLVP